MNTSDYLLQTSQDQHLALITSQERHTYGNLKEASACIAQELFTQGVRSGDRVGLLSTNSLFWVASYLAILKLGAVVVPFSATLPPSELQLRQNFIQCKVVCVEKRFYQRLPINVPLVLEDSLKSASTSSWEEIPSNSDEQQDAVLMFTSGTTARPRVVRITHQNIQANTESIISYLELTSAERMLSILPFDYCFGTSLLHTHLRIGGSLVLSRFLYPEAVLNLLEATECTGLAGVPSIYQTLLRNTTFPKRQLKSLRKVQQAGGKLSNVLIEELIAAVPAAQVYVMYGQTEATARLSYLPPEFLKTKLGSVGRGIPGVELRILGEAGGEVKPGEVGEIVARGANISPGYLDDPEATAEKFKDGALYTGDLATVDEDGFIYIMDRKADFIKSYGHRVSSQVVEACVLELADVVAAAAIGVPDPVRGEAIKVYVTLRNGSPLNPTEIIGHCKQRQPVYVVPQEVMVVKSLPMNENGKVLKSALRQQVAEMGQQIISESNGTRLCVALPG
ncbi:MAG: long-chain-fatty-acid--CoA ligase [Chloroflexota bacterium]|nr:MAG: long-chain-fatty-acid--CoA ligase [Chloroflexota bacterium]